MKPLVILGAGGHSKVLLDIAVLSNYKILGFSVPDKTETETMGYPTLGNDEDILNYDPDEVLLVNGLGSVASLERRFDVFERFHKKGFRFATLIHPSAIVAKGVQLAEGVQIMAAAAIQPGCSIGANSIINTNASVDHDCKIDSHVHICPGVTLSGDVKIGAGTHIGTGATVVQGITIGDWSLVGAGSVVLRGVSERQMVVGVPAKVIKNMRDWKKVLVKPLATIRSVIEIIDREAIKIALVVDENNHLLGSVTDGDIRRAIIANKPLEGPISSIMNPKPIVLKEKANRNMVLAVMRNSQIHQIPIVDSQSRVIGLELLENILF